jgi:nucleotide-binding universal stress UspA family protein
MGIHGARCIHCKRDARNGWRVARQWIERELHMKRILAAIDGSRHSDKALRFAADLSGRLGIELLIVHVATNQALSEGEKALVESEYAESLRSRLGGSEDSSPTVSGVGESILSTLTREAEHAATTRALIGEHLLAAAETTARASGAREVHTILSHGDPAHGILAVAKDNQVDVIVIGSHGFGELKSVLLGSVSNKVTHLADCTVATVR